MLSPGEHWLLLSTTNTGHQPVVNATGHQTGVFTSNYVMIYDDEIDTKSKSYEYWNPNPKTAFTINIKYIVIGRASRIHIDDVITSYLAVIWSLVIIYLQNIL